MNPAKRIQEDNCKKKPRRNKEEESKRIIQDGKEGVEKSKNRRKRKVKEENSKKNPKELSKM